MRGARQGHAGTSQLAEATQVVPDPPAQAPIRLRHRGDRTCPRTQPVGGRLDTRPGLVVHILSQGLWSIVSTSDPSETQGRGTSLLLTGHVSSSVVPV